MTETPSIPIARLREAVARGVITRQQFLALIADQPAGLPSGAPAATEAAHGLNAVTAAYYLGAAVVVFAQGWFLVERWDDVGGGGVLAIAAVYGLLFAIVARFLAKRGFRTAAAIATVLVVGTVALATWAILDLAGWWPDRPSRTEFDELYWIPVELSAVGAALGALRRVRFALLALPVTAGAWLAMVHLRVLMRDPSVSQALDPFLGLVGGTLLIAAGYLTERRQGDEEDYAFWPYLVGLVALVPSITELWDRWDGVPHLALLLALLAISVAVRLGRRTFLVAGAIGIVGYLGHLARLFENTSLFPLVLALAGGTVILATVWLQRRFPALVRGGARERRALPGGMRGPLLAVGIALALAGWARANATEWQAAEDRRHRARVRPRMADSIPAVVDTAGRAGPAPSRPPQPR